MPVNATLRRTFDFDFMEFFLNPAAVAGWEFHPGENDGGKAKSGSFSTMRGDFGSSKFTSRRAAEVVWKSTY